MPWEGSRILSARSIQKLSPAFQPLRCRAAGTPGTPCVRSGIHSLTLAVSSSQSSIDSVEQKVEGQPRKERFFQFFYSTYFHYFSLHLFGIMYTNVYYIHYHYFFLSIIYLTLCAPLWICVQTDCDVVRRMFGQPVEWRVSCCRQPQSTSNFFRSLNQFEQWTKMLPSSTYHDLPCLPHHHHHVRFPWKCKHNASFPSPAWRFSKVVLKGSSTNPNCKTARGDAMPCARHDQTSTVHTIHTWQFWHGATR